MSGDKSELKDRIEKAIEECERIIERYDININIDDLDICHIIEILKGRE